MDWRKHLSAVRVAIYQRPIQRGSGRRMLRQLKVESAKRGATAARHPRALSSLDNGHRWRDMDVVARDFIHQAQPPPIDLFDQIFSVVGDLAAHFRIGFGHSRAREGVRPC